VLTYAAVKLHAGPAHRVLGSGTVLDSSRFVTLIAGRIGVSVHNVHAFIVGEHGESELPLWSSAHVGNMPLQEFHPAGRLMLTAQDRAEILANVRGAAAQIIEAKGATNWAIGLAVARILDAILRNENAVLTVSRLLENYRGVSDVCLSVPCLVNRNGAGEPLPVPMSGAEIRDLQASAEVLKEACRQAGLS
jgi:L-lactate dehydrogenase